MSIWVVHVLTWTPLFCPLMTATPSCAISLLGVFFQTGFISYNIVDSGIVFRQDLMKSPENVQKPKHVRNVDRQVHSITATTWPRNFYRHVNRRELFPGRAKAFTKGCVLFRDNGQVRRRWKTPDRETLLTVVDALWSCHVDLTNTNGLIRQTRWGWRGRRDWRVGRQKRFRTFADPITAVRC